MINALSMKLRVYLATLLGLYIFIPLNSSPCLSQTLSAPLLKLQKQFRAHHLSGESMIKIRHSLTTDSFMTAASDGRLKIWSAPDVLLKEFVQPGNSMIFNARFYPNNDQYLTAAYSGVASLWSLDNSHPIHNYKPHLSGVTDLELLADNAGLVTTSDDGSIRYWSEDGQLVKRIQRPGVSRFVTQAKNRGLIAVTQDTGTVTLLNNHGNLLQVLKTTQGRLNAIIFNHDESILVTGGFDGTIKIWFVEDPYKPLKLINTIPAVAGAGWIEGLVLNNTDLLASTTDDGILRIWTLQGNLLASQKLSEHHLLSASFDRTGRILLTAASDGTISVLSLTHPNHKTNR